MKIRVCEYRKKRGKMDVTNDWRWICEEDCLLAVFVVYGRV